MFIAGSNLNLIHLKKQKGLGFTTGLDQKGSALTWNLHKLRIAQHKLGIPSLAAGRQTKNN